MPINLPFSPIVALLLILGSLLTFFFAMRYIRKSKVRIEDTFFWLFLSALLVFMSLAPNVIVWISETLDMMAPINVVFLVIIFLLIAKQFFSSLKLSQLEIRVEELAQQLAIEKKEAQDAQTEKKP